MSRVDPSRPDVVAIMNEASQALGSALPAPKDVFDFSSDEILSAALAGNKTATTSWPVPNPLHWNVGDYSVILDQSDKPVAVMQTLSFHRCKFRDVPEDFALAEAEGGYEEYRRGHFAYYGRMKNGSEFSDDSEVLCERFKLVYRTKEG